MTDAKLPRYDYKIHPLALLFPELPADEFKKLKLDIQAHGLLEPITLSADGETLLDGRHRLKACKELWIRPRIDRFDAQPNLTVEDFIWGKNFRRRHLTDDQRAMLSAQWVDTIKQAAHERQIATLKKGDEKPVRENSPKRGKRTREVIQDMAKVSEHTARKAEIVHKRAPHLEQKIISGEVTLKDAALLASVNLKWAPIREAAIAARWLSRLLRIAEKQKYFTVSGRDVWNRTHSKNRDQITRCKAWLEDILRAGEN